MSRFGRVAALMMLSVIAGCGGKEAECNALVGSVRSLGKKLTATQSVTGRENADPRQVASALRTFSKEAKRTGETIEATTFTVPGLASLAKDASKGAFALAEAAIKMERNAGRLRELDTARRQLNIQRTLADVTADRLQRACTSGTTDCAPLMRVLHGRPPLPDATADAGEAAAWLEKTTAWLAKMTSLELSDPESIRQRENLTSTTKSFAAALSQIAGSSDSAKDLSEATVEFSEQVVAIGKTLSAAQDLCKP
ncbi:MAG: hypothetical protein QM784_09005 [Polyangiaceae bacterium]